MTTKIAPGFYRYALRLPFSLRARLEAAAQARGRSFNTEIVERLEKSLDADDEAADTRTMVDDHDRRIADLERRMEDVFHMSGWRDYPGNEAD